MVKVKLWSDSSCSQREVPLDSKISDLKQKLCEETGAVLSELELVFCGRRIPDDAILSTFGNIRDHNTVYVLRRKTQKICSEDHKNLDPTAVDALVTSFHTALMDPQHRSLLFSIISNAEGLSSLISATPGLKDDTLVQGILKDPYLLIHWLTSDNVKELVEAHPCLVDAGQQIMSSLHQEAASLGVDRSSMLFVQGSDEEDNNSDAEEGAGGAEAGGRNVHQGAVAGQITTNQLAAALAAAGAVGENAGPSGTQQPRASPSPRRTRGRASDAPQASGGPISADAFQQAMLQAMGQQPPPPGQQRQQQAPDITEGMAQLTDMGFTNEVENRRALLATGGNFEAALEYIISERERMEQGMGLD